MVVTSRPFKTMGRPADYFFQDTQSLTAHSSKGGEKRKKGYNMGSHVHRIKCSKKGFFSTSFQKVRLLKKDWAT